PLDVSFFGPFKKKYSSFLSQWLAKNEGRVPKIEDIPEIIKEPYQDACKQSTAINGFRKTGLWLKSLIAPSRLVFSEEISPEPMNPEENVPAFNNGNDSNGNDSGSGSAEIGEDQFQDTRPNVLVQDSNTYSSENDDSSRIFNNSLQFRGDSIVRVASRGKCRPFSRDYYSKCSIQCDYFGYNNKFKSLVPYTISDDSDDDDEDVIVRTETLPNIEQAHTSSSMPFNVSPWDIRKNTSVKHVPEASTRKKCAPETSEENINIVKSFSPTINLYLFPNHSTV
ncbi:unnamed protein product, partial [Allacma fusca]